MYIQLDLSRIPLPPKFKRENIECYFDPYRKRLIQITPEETVRQKISCFFEKELGVPADLILLEVPLSYYAENTPGRADIVVHKAIKDGFLAPLAVIECKQPAVPLTDYVVDQAVRYCDVLEADYLIITNGQDLAIAHYDSFNGQYKWLNRLFRYDEMLDSETSFPEEYKSYKRLTMQQLSDPNKVDEYNDQNHHWVFGQNTPPLLRAFAVNLYECLMDTSHKLQKYKHNSFELTEDLGVRYLDYSNAGGGHYLGDYRSFLIQDASGNAQIVSISLFGTDASFRGENRSSYTSLVVAIDKYKTNHNSLQYNMDKYAKLQNNEILFSHNGQISSRPSQPLIALVNQRSLNININNAMLQLGKMETDRILYLSDPDVSKIIYNFIEYALIREDYCKSAKIRRQPK